MATSEDSRRYRAKQARKEQLARYGFTEGERPTEKVRERVREAVRAGKLEVPEEGFDDGTRLNSGSRPSWYPAVPPEDRYGKGYAHRIIKNFEWFGGATIDSVDRSKAKSSLTT